MQGTYVQQKTRYPDGLANNKHFHNMQGTAAGGVANMQIWCTTVYTAVLVPSSACDRESSRPQLSCS